MSRIGPLLSRNDNAVRIWSSRKSNPVPDSRGAIRHYSPSHWPVRPPWLKEEDTHYADVVFPPIRISDIVGGAEIDGFKNMDPEKDCLPDDMAPAPDQVAPVGEVFAAAFETGGRSSPK